VKRRSAGIEYKSISHVQSTVAMGRLTTIVLRTYYIVGPLLVIASGAGAASRKALGTAVFGGMLVSAVLATILVPAFYVIIQKLID